MELMGYFAASLNLWGQNECSLLEIKNIPLYQAKMLLEPISQHKAL